MPPRATVVAKGGQEALQKGGQPSNINAAAVDSRNEQVALAAMRAYRKHMRQHQFLISLVRPWGENAAGSPDADDIENGSFTGFDVSTSVDEHQHRKAFIPFAGLDGPDLAEIKEANGLSLTLMQRDDQDLREEATRLLAKLGKDPGEEMQSDISKLALKLISAELRRRVDRSKADEAPSGKIVTAGFRSRAMIDDLIRRILKASNLPDCFTLLRETPNSALTRNLKFRCAMSRGRQMVRCQGSTSASTLLKLLGDQNEPEVKVVIQLPHEDEGGLFPTPGSSSPSGPMASNADSDYLVLDLALSFDVKGKVVEPKKAIEVSSSSSPGAGAEGDFYIQLGKIKEEVAAAWDSVRVLVVKGREAEGDKAEGAKDEGDKAMLRALSLCIRLFHDLKGLGKMACAIVRNCTSSEDVARGGLVEIIIVECDLKKSKWGLAIRNTPPVIKQQKRLESAGLGRGGMVDDSSATLIEESLNKLRGVKETYASLLKDLGGDDFMFGKGLGEALKVKFEEIQLKKHGSRF